LIAGRVNIRDDTTANRVTSMFALFQNRQQKQPKPQRGFGSRSG